MADQETCYGEAINIKYGYTGTVTGETPDFTGAITEAKTFSYSNDQTQPSITGVVEGETYNYEKTITITDKNLASVTVNGIKTILKNNQIVIDQSETKTYTIVATDKAGHTTTVTFDMIEEATFMANWTIIVDGQKTLSEVTLPTSADGVRTWANPKQIVKIADGTLQDLEVIFTSNITTCIPEQHTITVKLQQMEKLEVVIPTVPENATKEEEKQYQDEVNNIVNEFVSTVDKETVKQDEALLEQAKQLDKHQSHLGFI